jgi:hypothetical protein
VLCWLVLDQNVCQESVTHTTILYEVTEKELILCSVSVTISRNIFSTISKKNMKKFIAPLFGLFLALGVLLMPDFAMAQLIQPGLDNPGNVQAATGAEGSFRVLMVRIVNYALTFLGLIAVFLLIYGGFLYMTSAGGDTGKAKNVLMYTAVGIIIILLSFAIVNTVLQAGL